MVGRRRSSRAEQQAQAHNGHRPDGFDGLDEFLDLDELELDGLDTFGEDEGWFDDGAGSLAPAELVEIDDALRQQFVAAYPAADASLDVLDELRPTVRRARRRRRSGQAVGWVAGAFLVVAAGSFAVDGLDVGPREVVLTGPAASSATGDALVDEASHLPLPTPASVSSADTDPGDDDGTGPEDEAGADDDQDQPETESGASSVSATTTAPPTTARPEPSPTTAPATTGVTPTTYRFACGELTYTVDGNDIRLVELYPSPSQADAEISTPGPHKIEVSIEYGSQHCELELRVVNGRVVVDD